MKKSLLALAVLASATTAAQAASSVTLYGKVEAAYNKASGTSLTQGSGGESRLGFKGSEDLGNGMAAIFQMEAQIAADTGALAGGTTMFNEKSFVGLSFSNGVHTVTFGRDASPIDRIGFSQDHLSSGLGWKSSNGNWQNAAFYQYTANGLTAVAGVTTKGGLAGNATPLALEGAAGTKAAYGASIKYERANFAVAAGYQKDNGTANNTPISSEWGIGGKYTFNPVSLALSFADAKTANGTKARRYHATLGAQFTPNDNVFVNFMQVKDRSAGTYMKQTHYGLGYVHNLSKRTELFANVGREKYFNNFGATNGGVTANAALVTAGTLSTANNTYSNVVGQATGSATKWDFGVRHSF